MRHQVCDAVRQCTRLSTACPRQNQRRSLSIENGLLLRFIEWAEDGVDGFVHKGRLAEVESWRNEKGTEGTEGTEVTEV